MATLNFQEASDLADNFRDLAEAIDDFRKNHLNELSKADDQKLAELKSSILKFGQDILALSTTLVMDEIQTSLEKINDITSKIKGTIQTLRDIQKCIDVAIAIVKLGETVIGKNPLSLISAINGVADTWNA